MIYRASCILALAALTACGSDKHAVTWRDNATGGRAPKPEERPAAPGPAVHPASASDWESVNYSKQSIAIEDLKPLSFTDVQHIRAIIFGKHGRIFEDSTLQRWLAARPWYHADKSFTNFSLSSHERENLDVVREAEAEKHAQIEPGDMRFYANRVITSAMLGQHSAMDWKALEGEILAEHGYVFEARGTASADDDDHSDMLQRYFEQRYWYRINPDFAPQDLSDIEKQNLDTISLARMRQDGRKITPGKMKIFASTPLADDLLQHQTLASLRLLRNAVYAWHGRRFQTPWIAEYFRDQPWYKERADFSDAELSAVERANLALINEHEMRLHEELGTKPLAIDELQDLLPEDARLLRNEIYARHGRRFKDPKLQAYFAAFAWYRPSNAFQDDQLNPIERRNAELIRTYESSRFTEA
jgi:hypothetical protein